MNLSTEFYNKYTINIPFKTKYKDGLKVEWFQKDKASYQSDQAG